MLLVTPALKDKVLTYLVEIATPEDSATYKMTEVLKELETDFDTFNAIMYQFERYGLIENLNLRHSYLSFILRLEAHDYLQKGGFVAQEEIFKANVEKLLIEIDVLKKELAPKHLETANKITSIGSAILAGLTLYRK